MNDIVELLDKLLDELLYEYKKDPGDCWISVNILKPSYNTRVLAAFKTVTGDTVECVAELVLVPRHCFENPPMDEVWFAYPSGGHRINPEYWMPYSRPPVCK